ncbi:wd-40 repeat protein [Stylonychia lemnae]|uniref:Wd-40 repeat protein n=1 Tax=Stylonychia lemnae TaxID=5949 RepID=A0A078BDF5_STYLE|nr:wd-40 repeat protein [Stylonychia lemnae]|eukprot:CDW91232.1 wd-40 repeat protein [Stylonychia lemnae]
MARFYPKDLDLILVWENHAFPQDLEVYNIDQSGEKVRAVEFEKIMKNTFSVLSLRKIFPGVGLKNLEVLNLPEYRNGNFKFSAVGNVVCMNGSNERQVLIFDSSDIHQLMNKIKSNDFIIKYESPEFPQMKRMLFSADEKVLIIQLDFKVKQLKQLKYLQQVLMNADVIKISDVSYFQSLRFINQDSSELRVKISRDLTKILLTNSTDIILYHQNRQEVLGWFKKKQVHKVSCNGGNEFVAISSEKYANGFDIFKTNDSSFKKNISVKTTPKIFKFFDIKHKESNIHILLLRDSELYVNMLSEINEQQSQYYHSYYHLEEFKWPYVSLVVNNQDILIISAFNPLKAMRITYENQNENILSCNITQSMNLFYFTFKKTTETNQLYMVDLDTMKASQQPLMIVHQSESKNQILYSMHVRNLNMNFTAGQKTNLFNKYPIIKISFSNYKINKLYQETDDHTEIVQFAVDKQYLYVLFKYKKVSEKYHYLKIFDVVNHNFYKQLYKARIDSEEFIGEMTSGYFNIIDQLMYFKNSVIKMKFINSNKIEFTKFDDCIHLNPSELLPYYGMVATYVYQRLMYMKKDDKKFSSKTAIIIPFINSKKVILNDKDTITQFCTLVEDFEDPKNLQKIFYMNPYELRYFVYSRQGRLLNHYGQPIAVSHNGRKFLLKGKDSQIISLFEMTQDAFKKIYVVDLNELIKNDVQNIDYLKLLNVYSEDSLIDNFDYKFQINDKGDLLILMTENQKDILKNFSFTNNISSSENLDNAIIYDFQNDIEVDSYDISAQAETFFDQNGHAYFLDQDYVIMSQINAKILSYQLIESSFEKQYLYFGLDKGHRVCPMTKNFILIRNYLAIGQSYLSLMMILEEKGYELNDSNFSIEIANYISKQECELHTYAADYTNINYILQKYDETDQRLFQQLLIVNQFGKTPLHIALENNDHKSVSIILKYLAKVDASNTKNFKDIFCKLLEYKQFQLYLDSCFFQTLQMKMIHTLNIRASVNDFNIVFDHSSSYLDNKFFNLVIASFTNILFKNQEVANQPVTLKGLDVGWIFNAKEGRKYLLNLSNHKDLSFFETQSTKIIISYLWPHYKYKIIFFTLIPYVIYHSIFLLLLFYNEKYFKGGNEMSFQSGESDGMKVICSVLLLCMAYFFYIILSRLRFQKLVYMTGMWAYLDIFSISLNLTIVVMCLQETQVSNIRRIEAVASTLMWLKFLYFFRIIDTTAPLVRMVKEILLDMVSFSFIYIFSLLAFANAFYVLAQNQLFEGQSTNDVAYYSVQGALRYVYLTSIGEFDHSTYNSSKDEHLLWVYLIITTVFLLVVLLNMLIAIMSMTFGRVADSTQSSILRERLQLIVENQFLPRITNLYRVKYLISIQSIGDQDQSEQMLQEVASEIRKTRQEILNEVQSINERLDNLEK